MNRVVHGGEFGVIRGHGPIDAELAQEEVDQGRLGKE